MKVYSVGQINNYLKNLIQSDYLLRNFLVKGEISNCKYHSMGHIYFSLKDETGSMPCVMFKGNVPSGLKFELKNGPISASSIATFSEPDNAGFVVLMKPSIITTPFQQQSCSRKGLQAFRRSSSSLVLLRG